MLVVLARHGNTFAPGETTVWVGGRTDLPLVEQGRKQAQAIGHALREADLLPRRTLAGPLKRTRETAALALAAAGLDPAAVEIDERLREIDYGRWEAKSSDQIRTMGDGEALAAWEASGAWPGDAGWPRSLDAYVEEFSAVFDGLAAAGGGPALVVSSNGVFRLVAARLAPLLESTKMATGAISLLRVDGAGVDVLDWNLPPKEFANGHRRRFIDRQST